MLMYLQFERLFFFFFNGSFSFLPPAPQKLLFHIPKLCIWGDLFHHIAPAAANTLYIWSPLEGLGMTLCYFKHFCNLPASILLQRLKRPLKSLWQPSAPSKLQMCVQAVTQVSVSVLHFPKLQSLYERPESAYFLSQIWCLLLAGDTNTLPEGPQAIFFLSSTDSFVAVEPALGLCPEESANMKGTSQLFAPRVLLPVFSRYVLQPYFSFPLLWHQL